MLILKTINLQCCIYTVVFKPNQLPPGKLVPWGEMRNETPDVNQSGTYTYKNIKTVCLGCPSRFLPTTLLQSVITTPGHTSVFTLTLLSVTGDPNKHQTCLCFFVTPDNMYMYKCGGENHGSELLLWVPH